VATDIAAATVIAADSADVEFTVAAFAPMAVRPVDTRAADMPEAM
jgi:hypothetical protein